MTLVKYIAALQEVQRQGEVHSAARAADQTQVADFWAAPIQNYWNEIAQTAALELLRSGERVGFEPDLRRTACPTRPDLRHRTGRDVRVLRNDPQPSVAEPKSLYASRRPGTHLAAFS
jgi:hypothetical protein